MGVSFVVNCASNYDSSRFSLELSEKYDFVYATCGVHPEFASDVNDELESELTKLLMHPKAVALGEIGLDYHYDDGAPREIQKAVFERQLSLAEKLQRNVIVHDREAHADCLEIIKKYNVVGVFHSFSGSYEMAKEIVRRGCMFLLAARLLLKMR